MQFSQPGAPSAANFPSGQPRQSPSAALWLFTKNPNGHVLHSPRFGAPPNLPAGHNLGDAEPSGQKTLPAGQPPVQFELTRPEVPPYFPAGHSQLTPPLPSQKEPGGQSPLQLGEVAPEALPNFPIGHTARLAAPARQ